MLKPVSRASATAAQLDSEPTLSRSELERLGQAAGQQILRRGMIVLEVRTDIDGYASALVALDPSALSVSAAVETVLDGLPGGSAVAERYVERVPSLDAHDRRGLLALREHLLRIQPPAQQALARVDEALEQLVEFPS
jgi:hypothetical protein